MCTWKDVVTAMYNWRKTVIAVKSFKKKESSYWHTTKHKQFHCELRMYF